MKQTSHHHWKRLPASIRKPLVLIVGSTLVLAAGATGWMPGPGGIPLFLIGVAILASEFVWAERFRDSILRLIHFFASWWRHHKIIGTIVFAVCAACSITIGYSFYKYLN